jgi:hypothetical protein
MTLEQAIALRSHQLQGLQVDPQALALAIEMIQHARPSKRTRKPRKACAEQALAQLDEPWPLVTPQTEAQILDPRRDSWTLIGSAE